VSSELGVSDEKILALEEYATSPLYEEKERVALEYAERMTITDHDVDDELFSLLRGFFDEDALVELTAAIAWENSARTVAAPVERLRGVAMPLTTGVRIDTSATDPRGRHESNKPTLTQRLSVGVVRQASHIP
jgi:hypothetical protein